MVMLTLLFSAAAQAEVAVPPLAHRVTDLTGTLDVQQKQTLETRLARFEAAKGAQIAVLLVPTTQPETIEQFGIRVAEAWKLGRKGVDDGALLLVAKNDHALRIEVGYGLEGALNDATAHRIIDEIIVPYFKRGEFYPGIDAGVAAIIKVVEGEPLPPPKKRSAVSASNNVKTTLLIAFGDVVLVGSVLLLFIAFGVVAVVGGILRASLGRLPAALLIGGVSGVLAWLTVVPLLGALLVGLYFFVFVLVGGRRSGFSGYHGGFGQGGGGGGGFGGGGFSGGGGGFGGGGASGGW